MIVTVHNTCVLVDTQGQKFYSESLLWYKIKQALQAQGLDVIKKLMYKDGHLVSDTEYYIRDRKQTWYIRDIYYDIRPMTEVVNAGNTLRLERYKF